MMRSWIHFTRGRFVRQARIGLDEAGLREEHLSRQGFAGPVAMRPNDKRYAAIAGPAGVDASVKGVVMQWPVINPLSRYRNAIRRSKEANPPQFTIGMKEKHDTYWHTEAEMTEGNPMLLLERGEKVVMPPALWHQGRPDEAHDYHDPDGGFAGNEPERFVSNYRKAGGDIEIAYFDNAKRNTDTTHAPVVDFMKKHLK